MSRSGEHQHYQPNHTPGLYLHRTTQALYGKVMDKVIGSVRDAFYDEGLDDQILEELKKLWKQKLDAAGVLDEGPRSVTDHVRSHQLTQLQSKQQTALMYANTTAQKSVSVRRADGSYFTPHPSTIPANRIIHAKNMQPNTSHHLDGQEPASTPCTKNTKCSKQLKKPKKREKIEEAKRSHD